MNIKGFITTVITAFSLLILSAPLSADNIAGYPTGPRSILVITGGATVTMATDELGNFSYSNCDLLPWPDDRKYTLNNYTVTTAGSIPGVIPTTYDEVWDLRFDQGGCTAATCASTITGAEMNSLRTYMAAGKSVMLLGENLQFPGRNDSVRTFVNSVVAATGTFATSNIGGYTGVGGGCFGAGGCCGVVDVPSATAAQNFHTDPSILMTAANPTGRICTEYPGTVRLTELAGGLAVIQTDGADTAKRDTTAPLWDDPRAAIGIGWLPTALLPAYSQSKLFVWLDSQAFRDHISCGGTNSNDRLVRNIFDFLLPDVVTTPTNTPTSTRTRTPTFTRTATPTGTQTATPTFTRTVTPTNTPSATPTVSFTNTQTATATFTRTNTMTITPTNSPTPTITQTTMFSSTVTRTHTQTATPTSTRTDTQTVTPTSTATPTITETTLNTSTITRTQTQTATPTATKTQTPSITVTVSVTNTPTFTPTSTDSPVYTRTVTVTNTPTFSQTVTYTNTPTFTPTLTPTESFTSTPTSTETLTFTPTLTVTYTYTITPTPPPYPYNMTIEIYNEAGERVKTVYKGLASSSLKEPHVYFNHFTGDTEDGAINISDGRLKFVVPSMEVPGQEGTGQSVFYWEGGSNNGQAVLNGKYYIVTTVLDGFGHSDTSTKEISILSNEQFVKLNIYNPAGELVTYLLLTNTAAPQTLSLDFDNTLKAGKNAPITLKYGKDALDYIVWDGRNSQGDLVASGVYEIQITVKDLNEKEQSASKTITILRENSDSELGAVKMFPNPFDKSKSPAMLITWEGGTGPLDIKIYNLNGELVKTMAAQAANKFWFFDGLSFSGEKLSGGVYTAVLTLRKSDGTYERQLVKFAMIAKYGQ